MPIPPKYVYEGDEEKARVFRGFAQSQLEILRNAMCFQGLAQDKRTLKFSDGTIIECKIDHGLEQATIYCPPVIGEEEEELEEFYARLGSPGGVLEQGATIGKIPGIKSCNEQGAIAPVELCKGAVLPFQEPIIVGKDQPGVSEERGYQVRGGVPPYIWKVSGKDYYFKDEDENHVYEIEGQVQPPICVGGAYHGWLGGLQGITGVFYTLFGGGVINKDLCERGGGYYLYRGIVTLYSNASCGGILSVKDICNNGVEKELEGEPPVEWDYENSAETISLNSAATVFVRGGSPKYTWTVEGTGYWFDEAHTITEVETSSNCTVLYADGDTACGSATITVVDGCGDSCTGLVRAAEGSWVHQSSHGHACASGYHSCGGAAGAQYDDYIAGDKRWIIGVSIVPTKTCYDICNDSYWIGLALEDYPPCGDPKECGGGACSHGGCNGLWVSTLLEFYKWEC